MAANCAKCGAELIGSGKFCATCGAPVEAPVSEQSPNTVGGIGGAPPVAAAPAPIPPAHPSSSSQQSAVIAPASSLGADDSGGYEPPSHVNPFAATASPNNPISRPSLSSSSPLPSIIGGSAASSGSIAAAASGVPSARIESKPPPSKPPTPSGLDSPSHVSPLAVSNALSERGAFQKAVDDASEKARLSVTPAPAVSSTGGPPPPAAARGKKPGTQVMVNAPNRPLPAPKDAAAAAAAAAAASGEAAPPKKKPAPRTQVMGFNPATGMPGLPGLPGMPKAPQSAPGAPAAPAPTPGSSPSGVTPAPAPQSIVQPPSVVHSQNAPQSVLQPSQQPPYQQPQPQPQPQYPSGIAAPYQQPQPAQPQVPPAGPGGWSWNAATPGPGQQAPPSQFGPGPSVGAPSQAQPPGAGQPPYQYQPFGYAPGSRVHVTWSNGQRYPATVSQVSGSQCLVVFPDGQQHWVEMQYLSPG